MADALIRLYRAHPRLRVHVAAGMSSELASRVATGDLDAAVVTEPVKPHPVGLVWTPLYEENFWLIAPPGYEKRAPRDLLSDMPFIRFDSRAWAGRMIARELDRLAWTVREEMVLDSLAVIVRMVEKGLGVAVAPLSTQDLAVLNLTRLPFGEPQLRRRVVLLERQERASSRFCSALADAVLNTVADVAEALPN
jgi:DNA-binding transcriptional LysR family regulator